MSERDRHIPDLVSKAQAAAIMGVSHQAVQQMIDNNRLPCAKVGNAWVIRRVVAQRVADGRRPDDSTGGKFTCMECGLPTEIEGDCPRCKQPEA